MPAIEEILGINKSRSFALLREYLRDPDKFDLTYPRSTPTRIPTSAEREIERPYHWLQDRIVRTCTIEKLTIINEVRDVLREELDRYYNHEVHYTTGEIPSIRFEKVGRE